MFKPLDFKKELNAFVQAKTSYLAKLIGYHMGWEPGYSSRHHLTAELVLEAAELFGDQNCDRLAIGLEFTTAFFEIHEDIQESGVERDGRESLWMHCGPAQALNIGDGVYSLGLMAIFGMAETGTEEQKLKRILKVFGDAVIEKCEGNFAAIDAKDMPVTDTERYLDVMMSSYGPIVGMSLACAAIANDDALNHGDLYECGKIYGAVKRIERENAAIAGEPSPILRGEFAAKRKPLAALIAMQQGKTTRRELGEIYMRRVLDHSEVRKMCSIVKDSGALDACSERLEQLRRKADDLLASCGLPETKQRRLGELLQRKVLGG